MPPAQNDTNAEGGETSLLENPNPEGGSLMGAPPAEPEGGSLLGEGDQKPPVTEPKLDANGNPIPAAQPKLDANGNPIPAAEPKLDKDGNPIKAGEGEETGAPDAYETFTVPEGMTIDETMQGQFSEVAKELDLPQAKAQKLVDLYAGKVEENLKAQANVLAEQRLQWRNEVRQDPKHEETLGFAKKAINRFAQGKAEGAKELLAGSTWMGDHPQIINFLANIGRGISEDTFIEGLSGGDGGKKDTASVLYPNQSK